MGKLLRFADDSKGCWARVDLQSGEPIWISIARTGVLIKVSRLGLFGAKLFEESDLSKIALICQDLSERDSRAVPLPGNMTNPVLRLMTSLALQASSAADLGAIFASARARTGIP